MSNFYFVKRYSSQGKALVIIPCPIQGLTGDRVLTNDDIEEYHRMCDATIPDPRLDSSTDMTVSVTGVRFILGNLVIVNKSHVRGITGAYGVIVGFSEQSLKYIVKLEAKGDIALPIKGADLILVL